MTLVSESLDGGAGARQESAVSPTPAQGRVYPPYKPLPRVERTCTRATCGQSFQGTIKAKLCPACRPLLRLTSPRTCDACGTTFEGPHRSKFCPPCRADRAAQLAAHRRSNKYVATPAVVAALRVLYADPHRSRGKLQDLATRLGYPRWFLSDTACALGLFRRRDLREWTPSEDLVLEEHAGTKTTAWIAKKLGRTVSSVKARAKTLSLSLQVRDGYTMTTLAEAFGVDHREVLRWINLGYLEGAQRRPANPADKGNPWTFTDLQVYRFVRDHPTAFELARVEQVWFLDLVLNHRANGKHDSE